MNGTYSASGSGDPQPPVQTPVQAPVQTPVQKVERVDPDADILLALARGKSGALAALMDRHLASIKSAARYMLGDEMMAEDIAQEVFLRAWKQAPDWQPGQAKFSTWLHRVAKNLCYDRLRKKNEIYPETVPDMVDDRPEASQTLEANQNHNAQKSRIEHAMAGLPERQRMAIILCHYRELSQIEAAAIMEVGVRAYESLLARARNNLRDQLQNHKSELLES